MSFEAQMRNYYNTVKRCRAHHQLSYVSLALVSLSFMQSSPDALDKSLPISRHCKNLFNFNFPVVVDLAVSVKLWVFLLKSNQDSVVIVSFCLHAIVSSCEVNRFSYGQIGLENNRDFFLAILNPRNFFTIGVDFSAIFLFNLNRLILFLVTQFRI